MTSGNENEQIYHTDTRSLDYFVKDNTRETILIGNDGGVTKITRIGSGNYNFSNIDGNGLNITQFYGLGACKNYPEYYAAGAQDNHIMTYNYIPSSWNVNVTGDGYDVAVNPSDPLKMFGISGSGTPPSSLVRTSNGFIGNSSFIVVPIPLSANDNGGGLEKPIVIDPNNSDRAYYGAQNVYKNENSWGNQPSFSIFLDRSTLINQGLTQDDQVADIAIAPSNSDVVYIGYASPWNPSQPNYLVKTENATAQTPTFTVIPNVNLNNYPLYCTITHLAVAPDDPQRLWVTFGNFWPDYIWANNSMRVIQSINGGTSFTDITSGTGQNTSLPDIPINCIKVIGDGTNGYSIYVGNDIGVYYYNTNESATGWTPLDMHLPPCIVTDIEYIHVSSKPDALRITTFGYGIWETLLDCSKDNNTQYISSSVTWSTDKVQHKDVFIESGGSLTITANVKFAGGTGIIVGKGGQLHVNGGTLTNACGTEWNGITVLGDPTQPFTDLSSHGFAQLMNSIVENACFGIRTSGSENSPAYYGGGVTKPDPPAGGIIYANHTKFINNHIDVSIAPCSNPKVDVFINCNFQISDDVLPPYSTHGPMVVLNDVNQVKFLCCNFTTLTSYRPDKAYGIGIKSTNSTFYVDPSCTLYNTSGCEQWKLSYFENLDYGVSATAFSSTRTLRIDTANFIGNNTGVYLSGISTAQVSRNIFTINSVDTNSRVAFGGVYLDQCNGYSVEQNTFSAVHLVNSVWSIGIVVNNSNLGAYIDANNKIYNNIFSSLDIGILPENKNRNNYDNAGLSILCNDFTQCKYDIAVTTDNTSILHLGIKNVQGENGNSPKQPAGNRFSPIPPLGAPHPDFRYHNECAEFTYYHHDQTGSGNNIVAPDPYYTTAFPNTITSTSVNQNNYTYKYICCPSNYTSGGGGSIEDEKSALKVEASSADSINNLLRTLVDGGNTTEVKSDVETSTTSEALAVYNFLLSLSPYLTDTVMVAALKQESVLTSDMITSILSENPQSAKSDTILQTIESRLNQLTDDQKAEIMLGLFITGAKESLESNLAASELNYSTSLNKILDYYASDSLSVSPKDSILHYTDGSPCLWARYHGIFALLDVKNKNGANQRMQALPNLFNLDSIQYSEHNFYNQLIGIYNNCADSGKSVLNCDSTTLVELNQVKQGSGGMAGIYARNILTSLNAGNYTEPYIFPKSGLKSLKIDWAQYKLSKSDELKIFPNPAKDYFIAEYSLTGNNTASLLRIIDNSGKLVKELSRHGDHEYLVVPVTDLTPGIYIVQLISDKNHILSAKLIVSR